MGSPLLAMEPPRALLHQASSSAASFLFWNCQQHLSVAVAAAPRCGPEIATPAPALESLGHVPCPAPGCVPSACIPVPSSARAFSLACLPLSPSTHGAVWRRVLQSQGLALVERSPMFVQTCWLPNKPPRGGCAREVLGSGQRQMNDHIPCPVLI